MVHKSTLTLDLGIFCRAWNKAEYRVLLASKRSMVLQSRYPSIPTIIIAAAAALAAIGWLAID
jgi:hypothetical protein